MSLSLRPNAILAAIVATGCAAEAAPPAFTARDSVGVRIVEYADTPSTAAAFTVSAEPLYRVGDGPGEHEFTMIRRGALQPDGGAVVVDGTRSQQLVLIGVDGSNRVLAGPGQGPTEIGGVSGVEVLGQDTILVQDYLNAKMMVFVGGGLARSVSTAGDGALARMLMPVGYERPGQLLMMSSGYMPVMQDGWIQGQLVRFDLETHAVDTVGAYDMAPPRAREGPMNPFGPFGAHSLGTGAFFVTGRSDIPEVTWRGPDGGVRQILRWQVVPRYPTEADLEVYADQMAARLPQMNPGMSRERVEQFVREQRERLEIDSSQPFPLFALIQGDGAGGVWISEFPPGGDPSAITRWSVIAPDGEWLGSVTVPEGFRVLDVSPDKVLRILKDSMEVESAAVFRLEPTGR